MYDQYGRKIEYMRISVTDRCNLRCRYCMPDDISLTSMSQLLTYEEILQVVNAAVSLGIVHFRITGGEPLVRRAVDHLVAMIKACPGVQSVTMTTNGVALFEQAGKLKAAGIDGINVSLDTVDAQEFAAITGRDALQKVLQGIEAATAQGIPVKLNAVEGQTRDVGSLIAFAQEHRLLLRFIEMMPIGHGREYMDSEAPDLLQQLEQRYGKAAALQQNLRGTQEMKERSLTENHAEGIRILGSGPAEYYRFDDLREPIGLIRSIHHRFCENCNRVRLTSEGQLKQCLCFESGIDLRQILREGSETNTKYVSEKVDTGTEGVRDRIAEKLQQCMYQAIYEKPSGHCFQNLQGITEEKVMGKIGG